MTTNAAHTCMSLLRLNSFIGLSEVHKGRYGKYVECLHGLNTTNT